MFLIDDLPLSRPKKFKFYRPIENKFRKDVVSSLFFPSPLCSQSNIVRFLMYYYYFDIELFFMYKV